MIKEQRPHTLEKSLKDHGAAVKNVVDKFASARANNQAKLKRAALFADLEVLLNKYLNIV